MGARFGKTIFDEKDSGRRESYSPQREELSDESSSYGLPFVFADILSSKDSATIENIFWGFFRI